MHVILRNQHGSATEEACCWRVYPAHGAASERGQGPALLGLAVYGFPGRRHGGLQVRRRLSGRCSRNRRGEVPLCGRSRWPALDVHPGRGFHGPAWRAGRW
jgi:hypothetical protein